MPAVALDRRQRRRQESIEEILDVALELMADQGVAGLSLGEVARQLGIRPPSLYVYFPSKHALYDALFERGARALLDAVTAAKHSKRHRLARTLEQVLTHMGETVIRWSVENPVYSQLLFWRPVPGFEPTPKAYRPAVELFDLSLEQFREMQQRGWVRQDILADTILRDWTILVAGIISQQMSNAPRESFRTGRFTTALPSLVAMFTEHYTAPSTTARSATPKGRGRREHQR